MLIHALVSTAILSGSGMTEQVPDSFVENKATLFGLVIGNNLSREPDVANLRYADDDAVRNAELLREMGAHVVLLTKLDTDSEKLYPTVQATPPTTAGLWKASAYLNHEMDKSRELGQRPVLYVFFSGHGDVENNKGYVELQDGRLWRDDFVDLLRYSTAEENHVVVDACKSFFLVFKRGMGGGQRSRVRGRLFTHETELPPNTGVLLSTSSANDSHEWEAFQAGIFSHEVRSAMRGAADHNLDGQLTYEEVAAFVWAANEGIPNRRFRPAVFTRAPGAQPLDRAVLLKTSLRVSSTLRVGPGTSEHFTVEDADGVRLADFRPMASAQINLMLPSRRPLFLREVETGREYEVVGASGLAWDELPPRERKVATRGAEHLAFRKLYDVPFGEDTLKDYRVAQALLESGGIKQANLEWLPRLLAVTSAGMALGGLSLTTLASRAQDDVRVGDDAIEVRRVNRQIKRYNRGATALYAMAITSAVGYIGWHLFSSEDVELHIFSGAEPTANLRLRF